MESKQPSEPNRASHHERDEEKTGIEIVFVGFPTIYDLFKKDRIHYSFSGHTLKDLVEDLLVQYGQQIKESFWDESVKGLDPSIQIVINEKYVQSADLRYVELSEGDQVTFLRLLAGG
jgi:molybdopterin converting factor small subunit